MTIKAFDRQDLGNPLNGKVISKLSDLTDTLDALRRRQPFFFELQSDNGYNLLLGLGNEVGCAQYSKADGMPPYMMTVSEGRETEQYQEFLMGDVPSPIPMKYCLPINVIKEVAECFLKTGAKYSNVRWEEI